MKIVYITSFFPPDRVAGAELGMHFMAEYMVRQGHDVHVVITRASKKRDLEIRSGYKIHWLETPNQKGLKFFLECRNAIKVIESLKPDLIHANCLLPGGYIAFKYGKRNRCKTVVLCYGYDVSDMSFPLSIWGRWALKGVDKVLVATEFCKNVVKKWTPNVQSQTFLAGCDVSVFPQLPLRNKVGDRYDLLFIGRMIPEKGFDFLLELMELLPKPYHLRVLGAGDNFDHYKNQAEKLGKRVEFLGQVPNAECTKWLALSHAMVLPSYREPFGVVCIESIVSGVPVVVSDAMGLPEAVEDEKNGIVVHGRDRDVWVEAIRKCCEDEAFRKKVHSHSINYREKWSWETRLKELEGIYDSLH